MINITNILPSFSFFFNIFLNDDLLLEENESIISNLLEVIIFYKYFLSIIFSLVLFIIHKYCSIINKKSNYHKEKINLGLKIIKNALQKKRFSFLQKWIRLIIKIHEIKKEEKFQNFAKEHKKQVCYFINKIRLLVRILNHKYVYDKKITEEEYHSYLEYVMSTIEEGQGEITKIFNLNKKKFILQILKWEKKYYQQLFLVLTSSLDGDISELCSSLIKSYFTLLKQSLKRKNLLIS